MARLTKETLKQLLADAVDNLSEEEWEKLASTGTPRETINLLIDPLYAFVPGNYLVCELKNNAQAVYPSDAVQCSGCSRNFCKKHKMDYCPECGTKL